MKIECIISGGQTGADRGGLDAAIDRGVAHGGWCPKGRLAEDGKIPPEYDLKEVASKEYIKRTEANVVDSDATLVFAYGPPTGGTKATVIFCEEHSRPCLVVDLEQLNKKQAVTFIHAWLEALAIDDDDPQVADRVAEPRASYGETSPTILNIAGPRESKQPGIQKAVAEVMGQILSR
jgi:hypothetical protein